MTERKTATRDFKPLAGYQPLDFKGKRTHSVRQKRSYETTEAGPSEWDDEGEPRPIRICCQCASYVPDNDPGVETSEGVECSVHSVERVW